MNHWWKRTGIPEKQWDTPVSLTLLVQGIQVPEMKSYDLIIYIHPDSHLKMEHGSQGYSSSLSILQPSYPSTFQLTVFQHLKLEFHGISLTPATSPAARFKVYVVVSSRKKTTGIANRKSNNCQFAKENIWTKPPLLGSMLIFQGVPHSSLSKNWNNHPLVYMAAIHLVQMQCILPCSMIHVYNTYIYIYIHILPHIEPNESFHRMHCTHKGFDF